MPEFDITQRQVRWSDGKAANISYKNEFAELKISFTRPPDYSVLKDRYGYFNFHYRMFTDIAIGQSGFHDYNMLYVTNDDEACGIIEAEIRARLDPAIDDHFDLFIRGYEKIIRKTERNGRLLGFIK